MDERQLRFSDAELNYVENTVDFARFEQVIDELAKDFLTVRVSRRWAGPMATPLFGDVAIVFALGAASGAFLAELGKDAYRGLKAGLFALYKAAKTWANNRGYAPFAIEQRAESDDDPRVVFHFTFPANLEEFEFEQAITSIPATLDGYTRRGARLIGFVYDKEAGWKVGVEA